jgi:signal transduction histidine kinase
MWKRGLVSKTVATFTIIVGVTLIFIAAILSIWFESYYFDQRKIQLDEQSELIASKVERYLSSQASEYTKSQLQDTMMLVGSYVNADVMLIDNYGIAYAVSNTKYNQYQFKGFLDKELEILRWGRTIEKRGEFNQITKEKAYMYVRPVFINSIFKGGIVMYTPMAKIREPLDKVYRIIWVSCILAVITSSFIIYYSTKKMIIDPLAQINYAARKISKGEVERRVYLKSEDEISELAEAFNSMADSLQKVENVRREFISNVSHELRSPITSIKGFIGGILDGVIPKDKENYYLSIAYEEIQRLTRLVNDLLDLSAIEAGKFSLRVTEIDINEIIRLCVIKFETKINMKMLKVDVVLQDEHLYVQGDRDRLVQVVTNLLDNAIKYVNDSGHIKINTKTKGDKVLVSVYNDGPCISEEDLKHIWDRFYKSDKSRTSKMSTGLGLPIVMNILTQLGEDVWVENKEKEGVTFYFTLKKI